MVDVGSLIKERRPLVVCLSPSFGTTSPEALTRLEAVSQFVRADAIDDQSLSSASALLVGTQAVDRSLIAACPNLRIIAKHGAGIDNIDVGAATEAGVVVTSAAGANAIAVAELTLALIMGLARSIPQQDQRVRHGHWEVTVGRSLEGSVLGIVGLGRIGRAVARRGHAFEMQVLGYDVTPPPVESTCWEQVDLDQLLSESDFVTVHVPLLPGTHHLITERQLKMMKPDAALINTSRGGVIDEMALAKALAKGWLARAALDVFEQEPPDTDHPIFDFPDRTILTPHMGAYADRGLARTSEMAAKSIAAALEGRWPEGALNRPPRWRGDPRSRHD